MKKYILFFLLLSANCHAQNATLVKDLTPGAASSFGESYSGIMGYIGDKLLLSVVNENVSKIYITEGTAASTLELQAASSGQQFFGYFVKTNDNRIAYTLTDYNDNIFKLYVTNGTTVKLMDKHNSSKPMHSLKIYGNYIYYISDHELRRIDLANTVDELVYGETSDLLDFYLESDFNTLYYVRDSGGVDNLFIANITAQSKTDLGNIGQLLVRNVKFTKVGSRLILGAWQNPSSEGTAIYSTDGTVTGTVLLAQNIHGYFPHVYQSKLYVNTSVYHAGFLTDGTIEGTVDFQDFNAYSFIEFNGELYFRGRPSQSSYIGNLLLNRDGSQTGGDQDEEGYVYYAYPSEYRSSATLNGKLYVTGTYLKAGEEDQMGIEIMEIKPDPTLPVYQQYTFYETKPGIETIFERELYATDSKLYFIGNEILTGTELYTLSTTSPTVLSVKEENNKKEFLNFYPNPVTDILHLNYSGTDPILSIYLRNLSGQTVQTYGSSELLDVSAVPSGMYFLEVQWRETTAVLKIIKK